MTDICYMLPLITSPPMFTDELAAFAVDLDDACRCLNEHIFVQICFIYAIISIVKAYVQCQARQNVKQRRDMLLSLYSHSCFLYILSSILWFTKQPERRIL